MKMIFYALYSIFLNTFILNNCIANDNMIMNPYNNSKISENNNIIENKDNKFTLNKYNNIKSNECYNININGCCDIKHSENNNNKIIEQQKLSILQELHNLQFQFYDRARSFCESITSEDNNNYYSIKFYFPRFLEGVYTVNSNDNKQINSISELFNLYSEFKNSKYFDIPKYQDDQINNKLLYDILSNKEAITFNTVYYINEIFKIRNKIDNLRKIFSNLEHEQALYKYGNEIIINDSNFD